MKSIFLIAVVALQALSFVVAAEESSDKAAKAIPEPRRFVANHQLDVQGALVKYQSIAEDIYIKNEKHQVIGTFFSTSYLRSNADGGPRPVTFVFNGGPGSASVWLHMGLLGPKRLVLPSDADQDDGAAPYQLTDNEQSLLDITDLVFIDPVGTGYSQYLGEGSGEDFWGLKQDAKSIAQFVRLWLKKHKRWNSPKYIIGESFGTTRSAVLTRALRQGGGDIALNGIVMISQALDYTGSTPAHDNLIAYVTNLPTMAAAAHYHGKAGAGQSLEAFLTRVRQFATDQYLPALFKGNTLNAAEREQIATQLAGFLGLDKAYVLASDLRVLRGRFAKALLRERGLSVGINDARYTLKELDTTAGSIRTDATGQHIRSAFNAAINHYMSDLGVDVDAPYITSGAANHDWEWDWTPYVPGPFGDEPEYVNVARILSEELRYNSDLKVLVANGYYDMVTPFFDAEYTMARHGFQAEKITMRYYRGGHMMYLNHREFNALMQDIRRFYQP